MSRIIRNDEMEPMLRVKVAQAAEHLDMEFPAPVVLLDELRAPLFSKIRVDRPWRIRLERLEPPQFVYGLQVAQIPSEAEAQAVRSRFAEEGHSARMETLGGEVHVGGRCVADNTQYRVVLAEFNNPDDVKRWGWRLMASGPCEIVGEKIRDARPQFEVFDAAYEQVRRVTSAILVLPQKPGTLVTLFNVTRAARPATEPMTLLGPLTLQVDAEGQLAVVREMGLESYVQGVLTAHWTPETPLETLKSLAVAVRGSGLTRLGRCHPQEGFDYCNGGECGAFDGRAELPSLVVEATAQTRGQVWMRDGRVVGAAYTTNCGGRDAPAFPALPTEEAMKRWMLVSPETECGNDGRHEESDRWEVVYSRRELEELLQQKTGHNVGALYDLLPLERNAAGHVHCLEVVGSQKSFKIRGALGIRKALSSVVLRSSCFVVDRQYGADGFLSEVTLSGAGEGQGSGLCLRGATRLADRGKNYHEILSHYFGDGILQTIYT